MVSCIHTTILEESRLHWASLSVIKSSPRYVCGFLALHSVSPNVPYANDGTCSLVCNTYSVEGKLEESIGWPLSVR